MSGDYYEIYYVPSKLFPSQYKIDIKSDIYLIVNSVSVNLIYHKLGVVVNSIFHFFYLMADASLCLCAVPKSRLFRLK